MTSTLGCFCILSALLTGNRPGTLFAPDEARMDTNASILWGQGTDKHFLDTANDRHGQSALLNGRIEGDGGSSVWGPWGGKAQTVAFIVDLKQVCMISKSTLWSCEDAGARGIAWYSLSVGLDEHSLIEIGRRRTADNELSSIRKMPIPLTCELASPAAARYVKVTVQRNPTRHQMVLGEFALWGEALSGENPPSTATSANLRPAVSFTIDGFSSGAAAIDWSRFDAPGDVVCWKCYASDRPFEDIADEGVKCIGTVPAKATSFIAYPLIPGKERHYAVVAAYKDGFGAKVKSVAHTSIMPLEVRRFADMLGVNFYWGGGSANEPGPANAWYGVVADFIASSHFRKIRWWKSPERTVSDEFLPRRIEPSNRCDDVTTSRKYGIYLHYFNNEPELRAGFTPEKCVAYMREQKALWNGAGANHVFYGPVVNIDSRGFEFLKGFAKAGGAEFVDAIDLHTYCGRDSEFTYPTGYPWGSPETLLTRIPEILDYLKGCGIDKPLTASEWGYSDSSVMNTHMEDPSPLRKAQFLVRGCIIHHRLGFRRLYLYSFFDEGSDKSCSEHLYGIVSRDLQKKPSYYALETMASVLGNTLFLRESKGCGDMGTFAYVFRDVDGNGYVTAMWNGAGDRDVIVKTESERAEIVDMFGNRHAANVKPSGSFNVKAGPSITYVIADKPMDIIQQEGGGK